MSDVLSRLDRRNLRRWLGAYLAGRVTRRLERQVRPRGCRHLLFALCDHYEPLWGRPLGPRGDLRVRTWEERYPAMAAPFRDSNGRPPRHSFFFAAEEYQRSYLDRLTRLVVDGFGEVELHLHHDGSTAAALSRDLGAYLALLREHGHLPAGPGNSICFGFIHGNWCLANSRPDGRWCGVDDELRVLWQHGCYADFTFPSAPDVTQPRHVNQIYWPSGDLARRAAHEDGEPACVGKRYDDRPLMISGPLALTWDSSRHRPRIENGALTGRDGPSPGRVDSWVAQNIHIAGRPEWVFVKVHTHGAPEDTAACLLGDGGACLHRALQRYNDGESWMLHCVSAREMYNVALAAMDGHSGNPYEYLNYRLAPPPVLS